MRVNVKVNVGPKTEAAAEDNLLAPRIGYHKLEKDSSIESVVHELVQDRRLRRIQN